MMCATIRETDGGPVAVDEHGDVWTVIAADRAGNLAVERDAGERWEAATIEGGEFAPAHEGETFDVDFLGEFVVRRTDSAGSLRWVEWNSEARR